MNKFKVGDRVRVNNTYNESCHVGSEGTITVVPDQVKKWFYDVDLNIDPIAFLFEESEIDLVEPTVPTAKFKVGDRVNLNDPAYTLAPNQQVGTVKCLTTPYIVTVDNFGGDLAFFEFELTPFVDTPVVEMSVLEKIVKVDSALRQLVTEGLPTDAAAAVKTFLISARLSDLARLHDLIVAEQ